MLQSGLRSTLLTFLDKRGVRISEEIVGLVGTNIERVHTERVDRDWIMVSTQANVEFLRHFAAHPDGIETAEPPTGTITLVRQLARQGAPLFEVLRAFQIGNAHWVSTCIEALSGMTDDPRELAAESIELVGLASRYFDRMCLRVSASYQEERDQWLRQKESARLEQVLGMLDGTVADIEQAEAVLGYRLQQRHLALVVWSRGGGPAGSDDLRDVQAVVDRIAHRLTVSGRPLVIVRDPRTVWAWLPHPGQDAALPLVREAIGPSTGIRVALGEPAGGIAGLVSSHKQAATAAEVGRISTATDIFPYRDVSSLSFFTSRSHQARGWIAETLGGLVGAAQREQELRRTLSVFIECHHSATAAARELHCHKNTVIYRLQLIEEVLGHPVEDNSLDLALALRALEWLGDSFLSEEEAPSSR